MTLRIRWMPSPPGVRCSSGSVRSGSGALVGSNGLAVVDDFGSHTVGGDLEPHPDQMRRRHAGKRMVDHVGDRLFERQHHLDSGSPRRPLRRRSRPRPSRADAGSRKPAARRRVRVRPLSPLTATCRQAKPDQPHSLHMAPSARNRGALYCLCVERHANQSTRQQTRKERLRDGICPGAGGRCR